MDGDPGAGRAPRGWPATAASFPRRLRGEDLCHPPRSHVACPVSAAWGPREPVRGEAAGSPLRAGEVVAPRRLAGPLPVTAPPCGPPVGRGAGRCLRRRGWREGRAPQPVDAEDAAGGAERVDGGGRVCGASGEELPGPGRRCHVPGPPGRHHPLCPGAVPSAAQRPPGRPPGQEPPLRVCGVLSLLPPREGVYPALAAAPRCPEARPPSPPWTRSPRRADGAPQARGQGPGRPWPWGFLHREPPRMGLLWSRSASSAFASRRLISCLPHPSH